MPAALMGRSIPRSLAVVLLGAALAHGADAAEVDASVASCAREFDEAQRVDMESFRDFDEATFLAGHHPDAVTIFGSGARRHGLAAIAAALRSHFADRKAVWRWTELFRHVDGCNAGYILYDATYEIPSSGFHQRALTAVTYVRSGDKWLAIADQGTLVPPPAPASPSKQ